MGGRDAAYQGYRSGRHPVAERRLKPMRALHSSKKLVQRLKAWLRRDQDAFLLHVTGVVHVGANSGQERHLYAAHGLDVVWIEPIPEVFAQLRTNIACFPNQRAICCLVSDTDHRRYDFNIANNDGQSSSILEFKHHTDVWPEVRYERTIALESMTLATLFGQHEVHPPRYQALVLDTQGAEMLVLRGAAPLLNGFRYVKVEAADFEAYQGCCLIDDVAEFLADHGFRERCRRPFAAHATRGRYYDVVFERLRDARR
jgi:FkbM family methyltransferase